MDALTPGQITYVSGPDDPLLRDPLLIERERTHGDFRMTATVAQELKAVVRNWNVKDLSAPQIESLEMICLKMARILCVPKVRDHWDDIAGYAKLGAEACDGQ